MMKNRIVMLYLLCLLCAGKALPMFSQCGEMRKNFSNEDLGEPILWGKPWLIPEIRLKVTERSTSRELSNAKIYMRYLWKHFQLPYYEFKDGKWDEAYDVISCTTNANGIVKFPEYEFVPRGWYNGDKLRGRAPQFKQVEVNYENNTYWIRRDQLDKIRKNRVKRSIELRRYDGFVPPIKIEIIP